MAKPFADGSEPGKDQTLVLVHSGGKWKDITVDVVPPEVDLTMHFRPLRRELVVQAGPFVKFERRDERGMAYRFGKREVDLVWKDDAFITRDPDSPEFANDDHSEPNKSE